VRHPQLQMTAYAGVLIVALGMPILTPWTKVTPESPSQFFREKIVWIERPGITADAPLQAEREPREAAARCCYRDASALG
jgi:hypothetical protein